MSPEHSEIFNAAFREVESHYGDAERPMKVTIETDGGLLITVSVPRWWKVGGKRSAPATHSADFRTVRWFGTDYTFTPTQAAIVRQLWDAWEDGAPGIGQETLTTEAGSESTRLRDLFREHPAWGTMITTFGKGVYGLQQQT